MLKPWPILFNDFMNNRTTEIHDRLLLRDREHIRLAKESRRVMDRLIVSLNPEQHQLFLEYESAANDVKNWEDEVIYRQGLIDGIKLKALIP
jgi:hypothetical protein